MTNTLLHLLKENFLAFVQGVAEIFPVSSSAHLVLFGHILDERFTFNQIICLHIGTFLSILVFYRRKVWAISTGKEGWRLPAFIGIAFVGTTILGFVFKSAADRLVTGQPNVVVFLLILNGITLGVMSAFFLKGERTIKDLTAMEFLMIGLVQGISALPGISRLGFTLGMGLFLGLSWLEALNLSFLLSLPTIFFANLYIWLEQKQMIRLALSTMAEKTSLPSQTIEISTWPSNTAAISITFLISTLALNMLFKHFSRKLLAYFAIYCISSGLFFFYLLKLL